MKKLFTLLFLFAFVIGCKKGTDVLPDLFLGFKKPSNFPEPVYDMSRNEITKAGFELGKRLFYEPVLSRNNTISCGSCHIQSAAFTHHGHDVSHGIDDQLGTRNPLPLMNLAWSEEFFWDGGVFHLDLTGINAITSPVEMDESVPNVILKLRSHKDYPALFNAAFGSTEITDSRFLMALSKFMLMAVSSDSKYDKIMRNEETLPFTPEEQSGYLFFQEHCASCHKEPLFTVPSYHNNGLQPSPIDDKGRYEVTLHPTDRYKFKVPSLRNLEYTAPYMHDGRFLTLNRVLEHYRSGMVDSETLDPEFRQVDGRIGIPMTDTQKDNLTAFLRTLGDREFLTNALLGEPIL